MKITAAIREAHTQHEVFFLLTAYIEAIDYGDGAKQLPWQVRELPLAGVDDVKGRIYSLHLRARLAGPDSDDKATAYVVDEVLEVYTTALRQLAALEQAEAIEFADAA